MEIDNRYVHSDCIPIDNFVDTLEIMQKLPTRLWQSIRNHASKMGIRRDNTEDRKRHSMYMPNSRYPCLADIEYAQEHGLVLSDKKA